MNLSEIAGKEIVNLVSGERLGVVGECDLILDETTGDILALLVPKEKAYEPSATVPLPIAIEAWPLAIFFKF